MYICAHMANFAWTAVFPMPTQIKVQQRVEMCRPMGGTGLRLTSVLICKMSKREGKLSDKELKDNVCCLDHGC